MIKNRQLDQCKCANEMIDCLNCANSDHDEHCQPVEQPESGQKAWNCHFGVSHEEGCPHQDKEEGWEIKLDSENEQYKLLKKNAIKTSEGVENEWVASIYELEDFNMFISQVREDARREVIEEIRKIHLCQFGCTFCKKYLSKKGGE